ncbi:glutamate receptor ionotropic, kainate 2-like [Mercenaria mercenaria]|uniref:glutamate receptor ionotropic, kainate 2-like n=1 Tax=Mercenaria mercenaria TaxID=6596 RepID=UPI00234FB02B|nr:glutamate receptor ionotropic, kainate 2-like [Mercenaria mercenaria]
MFSVWTLIIITIGFYSPTTAALPDHFRVAGLFEPENVAQELAFKAAIEKMNLQQKVGSSRMIVYHVEHTLAHDSFEANKEVCRQMKEGIAAVFGPITKIPRAHVQSICNSFEIPHLNAQWDARDSHDYFSISVYPDYNRLSQAYADLINYWGWKRFTVIYEDDDGLLRLQEVLKATKGSDHKITVRRLDLFKNTYITMFKDLKEKGEYHIIVDCDVHKVQTLLHEALKVNMLSELYHFHFTTLDLDLVNLEDYKYSGANITAIAFNPSSRNGGCTNIPRCTCVVLQSCPNSKSYFIYLQTEVATEVALMYDAVNLFANALKELTVAQQFETVGLSCNKKQTWQYGNSLLNYMKSMDMDGLSGDIRFNNGKRTDFKLDIIELSQSGLRNVGNWQPRSGINITTSYKDRRKETLNKLSNMTLRIVTVYDPPYLTLKTGKDITGPKHEGFMVDLLELIKSRLGFNYSIYQVADQKYGNEVTEGKWNGMIGDLMQRDPKKRADMAAAGMTITYEREKVVDFTKPFLNLGITVVYKKPTKAPPELFSFSSPLSIHVWIYMVAAYLCVSFMLFVIARFSPYEWTNPHPCNEDSDLVENQFTICNSLWFTIGSLMQQGCEIAPRAISTRIVACIWWFFTLIMISSYTANLAAFLTVERMVSPIESVDDLAKQTKIKYGTISSGSTKAFFQICKEGIEHGECKMFNAKNETTTPYDRLSMFSCDGLYTKCCKVHPEICFLPLSRSDLAPTSASGRILASSWYLFTLIMVSTYTANLAAFLVVEQYVSPIKSVEDLPNQIKIQYGTLNSGSTKDFFRNSDILTYKRMWSFMNSNPNASFVEKNADGFMRAKNSDYAYIAESTTIDYQVQRICELKQIGGLLDSKGYGLAFPKDSPWTDEISREIIYFQENQEIQKIYNKWWKEKSGGKCEVDGGTKDASSLGVKHVGGVFVVLVGGLVAGLFIACMEFMWKARKNAKKDKQSFCSEMSEELRFAVKCFGGSEKTTRRVASKEIIDNGVQFTPMIPIPNNRNQKELYA